MIQVVANDLSRAILNIANNGCNAAYQKSLQMGENFRPTLRVSTRDTEGQIEIRIEDNGTGISKEALPKIFNPFFTTKPPGSGGGTRVVSQLPDRGRATQGKHPGGDQGR